ncbi:hypothetical protein [Terrarubrum flagellatum]|uniref:hypothetical protein n=1 Tax=Terrirubrum flagellatum TaxID=2895980 RepID=UPI003145384F
MVKVNLRIAPPHSILFLSGPKGGVAAEFEDRLFLFSPTCISFRCLMEHDGETDVTIGDSSEIEQITVPNFDEILRTPDKVVMLSMVAWKSLTKIAVETKQTRVRIWVNHPIEPDQVVIALN